MTDLSPRLTLLALLAGLALPSLAQTLPQSPPQTQNGYGVQQPLPAVPNGGVAQPQPQVNGNPYAVPAPQSVAPNGYLPPEIAPPLPPHPAEEPPKTTTPPSATLSDLGRSLRNYFTEDELSLLFQYMKESVMASFKDEEVSLPPDLAFKLEILLVRMKKESGHYMDNLIDQLEKDLKTSLKEKLTPPPIKEQPYNPWFTPPQQ